MLLLNPFPPAKVNIIVFLQLGLAPVWVVFYGHVLEFAAERQCIGIRIPGCLRCASPAYLKF